MPAAPVIKASIDFSNGVAFVGQPFILDSVTNGILGTNQLGTSANANVDISNLIWAVSIRRGRQRLLNEFEAGTTLPTLPALISVTLYRYAKYRLKPNTTAQPGYCLLGSSLLMTPASISVQTSLAVSPSVV